MRHAPKSRRHHPGNLDGDPSPADATNDGSALPHLGKRFSLAWGKDVHNGTSVPVPGPPVPATCVPRQGKREKVGACIIMMLDAD